MKSISKYSVLKVQQKTSTCSPTFIETDRAFNVAWLSVSKEVLSLTRLIIIAFLKVKTYMSHVLGDLFAHCLTVVRPALIRVWYALDTVFFYYFNPFCDHSTFCHHEWFIKHAKSNKLTWQLKDMRFFNGNMLVTTKIWF